MESVLKVSKKILAIYTVSDILRPHLTSTYLFKSDSGKMKVGFSMRNHSCLILQVVTLVVCFQGKLSSAEIAQGCIGSRLRLECPEMKVISVTSVVLGDSYGTGTLCSIKDNDCTHGANEQHTTEVHSRCDGKRNCTVGVLKEKIPCGFGDSWSNNDFERITYDCIDDPGMAEIAQGCVGSQLGLECPEMKVISVTSVVLGNSKCWATLTSCCIRDNDCIHDANEQHTTEVRRRCDGKRRCTVGVLKEKIPCGYVSWSNNDFERITYDCIDDPGTSIIATTSEPEATVYRSQVKEKPPEFLTASIIATNSGPEATVYRSQAREKPLEDETTNGIVERVALIAVCTIVLIAIIVLLSIVLVRRKRKQRLKSSATVKTSAGIHGRDSQAAGSGQAPGDGTNELLDSSRNYEPLDFYEQLQ